MIKVFARGWFGHTHGEWSEFILHNPEYHLKWHMYWPLWAASDTSHGLVEQTEDESQSHPHWPGLLNYLLLIPCTGKQFYML